MLPVSSVHNRSSQCNMTKSEEYTVVHLIKVLLSILYLDDVSMLLCIT